MALPTRWVNRRSCGAGELARGAGQTDPTTASAQRDVDGDEFGHTDRAPSAVVAALREFDDPDLHTQVVVAVGGPHAQRLAAEDTVNHVLPQTEPRAVTARRVRAFEQGLDGREVELALHVPVIGDAVAPCMASPDTDPVAVREADALGFLAGDPAPRRSAGGARRRASPTSCSEQTSPARSPLSSPSWLGH